MTRRNWRAASPMPAAHQRSAMAVPPPLDVLPWSRQISIIDSTGSSSAASLPGWAARPAEDGQGLGQALSQAGRGAGVGLGQLAGKVRQVRLGGERRRGVVGQPHPSWRLTRAAPAAWPPHSDLVQLTPMDHRRVEHGLHRRRQRLGAVEHAQDRPARVQAAVAQLGQQVPHDGGVLGGALKPRGCLSRRCRCPALRRRGVGEVHPSIMNAPGRAHPVAEHQSANAVSVAATNRREIADFASRDGGLDVGRGGSRSRRSGGWIGGRSSAPAPCPSTSVEENRSRGGRSSPERSAVRTRGRLTGRRRPPKVTEPSSVPCRTRRDSGCPAARPAP